jgi:hypothetical protein
MPITRFFICNPGVSLACSGKLVSDTLAAKDSVECDHFGLSPCDRCNRCFRDLCRYSNSDVSPAFSFAGGGRRGSRILARAGCELVGSQASPKTAGRDNRFRSVCVERGSFGRWSCSFDL